jgi:hypothetical protein
MDELDEEQLLQNEYEQECMQGYPLTWELDEHELDHSYSGCYDVCNANANANANTKD